MGLKKMAEKACVRVRARACAHACLCGARTLLLQRAPERIFARNSLCLNHTYQIQPWLPKTPTLTIYSAIILLKLRHYLLKRIPHLDNSQHDKVSTHTRKIKGFSRRPPGAVEMTKIFSSLWRKAQKRLARLTQGP